MEHPTIRDLTWLPLLSAALLGCGSVGGSTTGVPIGSAPVEIAQAVCPKAYTCCLPAQLMGNDLAGTDEPSCEVKTAMGFKNNLDGVVAAQKAGRLVYDGDKLAACLAHIRAASCDSLDTTNHFTGVPGCDSFVRPLVALGGACTSDLECIAGWCLQATTMTATSGDGACTAFAQAGQACGDAAKCAQGLTCDGASHTCAAPTPAPSAAKACFYASACAVGGNVRPTLLGALMLAAGLAAVAARRRALRRAVVSRRHRPSYRA